MSLVEAEQLVRNGDLMGALDNIQAEIRTKPENAKFRVFLFQLLAVLGKWDRALTQLNVAADLDKNNLLMAQVCREALSCEALRAEIFAGQRSPLIFGEPEEWVGWMVKALQFSATGQFKAAQDLREKAYESAPAVPGVIDGQKFEWIADADSRLGPMLEAIIDGRYYWIPISNVSLIKIEEPEDLRDVVWMPANFIWKNGGNSVGLIPTRYPGSEQNEDAAVQLGRKTDWLEQEGDLFIGLGQRMFATDQGEYPALDARNISLYHPQEEQSEGEDVAPEAVIDDMPSQSS